MNQHRLCAYVFRSDFDTSHFVPLRVDSWSLFTPLQLHFHGIVRRTH